MADRDSLAYRIPLWGYLVVFGMFFVVGLVVGGTFDMPSKFSLEAVGEVIVEMYATFQIGFYFIGNNIDSSWSDIATTFLFFTFLMLFSRRLYDLLTTKQALIAFWVAGWSTTFALIYFNFVSQSSDWLFVPVVILCICAPIVLYFVIAYLKVRQPIAQEPLLPKKVKVKRKSNKESSAIRELRG